MKKELRKKSVLQRSTNVNTTSQFQETDSRLCSNIKKISKSDRNEVFSFSSNQRNSFQFVTFRRGFKKNLFEPLLFIPENNNASNSHKTCIQGSMGDKLTENSTFKSSEIYNVCTVHNKLVRKFNEFEKPLRNITNCKDAKTNCQNLWFECQKNHKNKCHSKYSDRKSKHDWNNSENLNPDCYGYEVNNQKLMKQEVILHSDQEFSKMLGGQFYFFSEVFFF